MKIRSDRVIHFFLPVNNCYEVPWFAADANKNEIRLTNSPGRQNSNGQDVPHYSNGSQRGRGDPIEPEGGGQPHPLVAGVHTRQPTVHVKGGRTGRRSVRLRHPLYFVLACSSGINVLLSNRTRWKSLRCTQSRCPISSPFFSFRCLCQMG